MADQPGFRWSGPTLSVGWGIAFIVLIVTILLKFMGQLELAECLAICAICAVRL